MDLDLFCPRRHTYWEPSDWPHSRSLLRWSDPFEDLRMPSQALAMPQSLVQRGGTSKVVNDSDKFEVKLDCSHFKPEEIEVKTVDNNIVIHGKHEEKVDKHGWVSREFTRRYTLPNECDPNHVVSSLNPNGVLAIEAPKKELEPPKENERVVPINVVHELSKKQIQN